MTATSTQVRNDITSLPRSSDTSDGCSNHLRGKEEFDQVLRAMEVPFDVNLVQWRVTEWSEDGTRGLMMPYADPRAYTDRLNRLFTPAGWTRRYTVQNERAGPAQ